MKNGNDYRIAKGIENCDDPMSDLAYSGLFEFLGWNKKVRARLELFLTLMGLTSRKKERTLPQGPHTPHGTKSRHVFDTSYLESNGQA